MTQQSETYFSLPSLPWILLCGMGMCLLFGSVFLPSMVPFDYLGPLGSFAKYMKDEFPAVLVFLVAFTVVSHFVEVIFCMRMCRKKNISQSSTVKWFLSTMIFGGLSLYKLCKFKQGATKLKE